jgi:hypothetical protein
MPFPPKQMPAMDQVGPAVMPGKAPMPDFEAFKKKHHKPKEHKRGENLHGRSPKERGK